MSKTINRARELLGHHEGQLAFVVNHSGGKDSMRMLGWIRDQLLDADLYPVLADTGFEHQSPVSSIDWTRERYAELGLNLTVVRNPIKSYLEMVRHRRRFPSAQFRPCTSGLKRGLINKFVRSVQYPVVINCIRIRSEESPPFEANRLDDQPITHD
jgi:DNA sulfur modification protein DndC